MNRTFPQAQLPLILTELVVVSVMVNGRSCVTSSSSLTQELVARDSSFLHGKGGLRGDLMEDYSTKLGHSCLYWHWRGLP